MNLKQYAKRIEEHYTTVWNKESSKLTWVAGPVYQLPSDFHILKFPPNKTRNMWSYATCCMSLPDDECPLELHIFSDIEADDIGEILSAVAHYHRTGSFLGLGHTVNFGRPWVSQSFCDHGLISLPYLDGQELEWGDFAKIRTRFLWLIPITDTELDYKKHFGLDAIEVKFEQKGFHYADPYRMSVI